MYLAFNLYFALLLAIGCARFMAPALGAAIGDNGWSAGASARAGGVRDDADRPGALYFLASPLVLIYLWLHLRIQPAGRFGEGLRSRQHFQQQLEISTANPHDADAHYQLGLIYQQRRQYTDAIARFERAVEIDRSLADAHLQLGVIAREQGSV